MWRLTKFVIAAGLVVIIPGLFWLGKMRISMQAEANAAPETPVVLASSGRVEGNGETISVGAAADGVITKVFVTDGQEVQQGSILALISCDDLKAEIDQARAQAESLRQVRIRLLRGHRDEERRAAAQQTAAALAVLVQAQEHLTRMDLLYQKDSVSKESFEESQRDSDVAQANYENARAQQDLIDADPLPEEKSRADQDVVAAEHNISVVTEKFEKCNVRAPISGTVLRVMTRAGESYSTLLPRPLFNLVDDSTRRVRAEVDERDISKIKMQQHALITADGYPGRQFDGHVIQLAHIMGRKSVLTGDPAEKVDRDILEVVVELEPHANVLPVGLRVTARFF